MVTRKKTVTPKSINDLKLIHAGKILENNKSLADSRITFGDLPAGVVTMHVVVQPAIAKNKTEKSEEDMQKPNSCREIRVFGSTFCKSYDCTDESNAFQTATDRYEV